MGATRKTTAGPSHGHDFWKTPIGLQLYNGAETVAVVSAIATGLALAYIGYGVAQGHLARAAHISSPAFRQFAIGATAFFWGCTALVLSVVLRFYHNEQYMLGLLALGAAAFAGVPFGVNYMLAEQHAVLSSHAGANVVNDNCRSAGIFVFIVVGLRFAVYAGLRLHAATASKGQDLPEIDRITAIARQRGKRAVRAKPRALAACWELPYCEDYLREQCPNYTDRKSCWRRKSGCHCDSGILTRALGLESPTGGGDPELRSLARDTLVEMTHTQLKCRDCRIFLDHQYRKFRALSPLTPFITAALVFLFSQPIRAGWKAGVEAIAAACNVLSFEDGVQQRTSQLVSDLTSDGMVWGVYIIGGLFLMSAVARAIEWVTLELKL